MKKENDEKKISGAKALIQLSKDLRELKKFKGKDDDETYRHASKIVKSAYEKIAVLFKKDDFVQTCIVEIKKAIDERNKENYDNYTKLLKSHLITKR